MTTVLRPYQLDAVAAIRQAAREKESGVILHMATGAGKTACFADVLKGAYLKGKCAIMVVRGKQLVHQASDRLTREEVPHGIFQANRTRDTHERILVCSVDTLFARKITPPADLIVIDECHLAHSDGYKWLISQYPSAFRLGVSATPHHKRGMRHLGGRIVRPATITELIAQKFLVGGRYFVPYVPNLRGVSKSAGDFNGKELSRRVSDDSELTASAAKIWAANLQGKSTLVYGVSVEHAGILADGIRGVGGRCEIIIANTKDGVRRDYIRRLENGDLDCLVSVGVLTTGIDIPSLRAILCCRPTESYNLWIQILGRGTRPFPGKETFLCYDLGGNLLRHGPIESEMHADLDGPPKPTKISLTLCGNCYATFESGPDICPACGSSLKDASRHSTGKRVHGLTDNDETREVAVEPWEIELPDLIAEAKLKLRRKGWIYYRIKTKYGDEAADKAWKRVRAMKKWPTRDWGAATTPKSSAKSSPDVDLERIAGYGPTIRSWRDL